MAAATACASPSSLAGQAFGLSGSAPAAGKANVGEAHVSIEATATVSSIWNGADCPKHLSALSGATPSYPTCDYPGENGWDTAGLSSDPGTFAKNREFQQHSVT